MRSLVSVLTLFLLAASSGLTAAEPPQTRGKSPLDDYVQKADPTYEWKVAKTTPGNPATTVIIQLKSQAWRTEQDVDRTVWEHWLVVVKPEKVTTNKAFLMISGSSNDRPLPDGANPVVSQIAHATGSIVAELRMVPNQSLVFHGDGQPRKEDDLIAYAWDQFLKTGDATWLPRLPMVKSVVRAMDCLQEWSKSEGEPIEKFVVAGASKRGWTTWLTGAADQRVEAIIPIVIDVVHNEPSIRHHAEAYGFWAKAIGPYYKHQILQRPDHPRMKELYQVEDPYSYLDRLTMPKYVINASGDQFFCPDSSQFYFDDLKGEKLLRYVPNADHSLKTIDAMTSLIAYYQMILAGKPRPNPKWTFEKDGSVRVTSETRPKQAVLWQANNPKARDFRLMTIGKAFTSTELKPEADGSWVARIAPPAQGWTAFFVELAYDSGGAFPLQVSTAVRVLPDTLPHKDIDLKAVPYEPDAGEAPAPAKPDAAPAPAQNPSANNGIVVERVFGPELPDKYKHPASFTELTNGDLYLAYYGGSGEYADDTWVRGARLPKGGTKWTTPEIIADTPFRSDGNPVVWQAPDGLVWLFYVCRYGPTWSNSRIKFKVSRDGAKTWSDSDMLTFDEGTMVRGQPIALKNGDYLLGVYHETGEDREIVGPDTTSFFLRKKKGSDEWTPTNKIRSRLGNLQPSVVQISDDHLVAYSRRGGGYGPLADGFLVRSESRDGGFTWSEGKDSLFPNPNAAADFIKLGNGHLLLVFNDNNQGQRMPLTVAISTDNDQTYPHRRNIVNKPGDSAAYPVAIQTRDGKIHVIYTSEKRTVINHAVFDESEILNAPPVAKHVKVYAEPGRFGGWPANHGIWSWGNEILVGFGVGYHKDLGLTRHAIDRERPEEHVLARSRDGGETWSLEYPGRKGMLVGARGMRHGTVPPDQHDPPPTDCPGGIDFTHPDFAMTVRMADKDTGESRFYFSNDRGHIWKGPFRLPLFGQKGIMARTDYVVHGKHDCMLILTAAKENGLEGRPLCVRTTDGGKTWQFVSWIGPEPKGYAIMPSTIRLGTEELLTAIRCREGDQSWIDSYRSRDGGKSWSLDGKPAPDTGEGNPPSMIRLADGRVCLTYGYRAAPFGIRARLSSDGGQTWAPELTLRGDGGGRDVGYPCSVQRPDGKVVTVYYYHDTLLGNRYISATIWE